MKSEISAMRKRSRIITLLLVLSGILSLPGAERLVEYTNAPEAESIRPFDPRRIEAGKNYESILDLFILSVVPLARIKAEIIQLDPEGSEVARTASDFSLQPVFADGCSRKIRIAFTAHPLAGKAELQLNYGGNPVVFSVVNWNLEEVVKKPLFGGIYNDPDPYPADRQAVLDEMAKTGPATASVEKRNGIPALIVDGKQMPLNAYKGHYDFSKFGEAGGDLVITFNCGMRLYSGPRWDKALWDPVTKSFDYSAIENNLMRIFKANPRARVILSIDITPPAEYLEAHPENIVLNGDGVRGKSRFTSFAGWDNSPLKKGESWAWSYFSETLKEHIAADLRKLVQFLRSTPAGNIVIGFQLAGGHDGQFIQWEYGCTNGHFDYSEAARKALCSYLKEIYGSDDALREAWGDPEVTLQNASNPSPEEFHSMKFADDRPGLGRKIADCRRFIAVGTARMLNFLARTLKDEWKRPAVVEMWYSTAIWAYPTRLALDELIRGEAVNIIGMVTNYAPFRFLDGPGGSANSCIQALNLRNVMYIQEMDHRTWRTERTSGYFMNAVAFPEGAADFRSQLLRDASSVLALGGQGFYLYDMFGSWYNDPEALKTIRTIYAMNTYVSGNAGKFPRSRTAILMDEATRLMSEYVPNYVTDIWRLSGITPALHFLSDLTDPEMPEYDLYVLWSPLTIDRKQLAEIKKRADRPGKVLVVIGDAGRTSRDFAGTAEVLDRLGLRVLEDPDVSGETIIPAPGVSDPVLDHIAGVMEQSGMSVGRDGLKRREVFGCAVIDDPEAKILGVYETSRRPAFAVKKMPGGGTLYCAGRNGALTSQMLHNFARAAGIEPYAEPGNAVFVGNGVAAIHRLSVKTPEIDFGRETVLINPVSGEVLEKVRIWRPRLNVGECAAVCYLPYETE